MPDFENPDNSTEKPEKEKKEMTPEEIKQFGVELDEHLCGLLARAQEINNELAIRADDERAQELREELAFIEEILGDYKEDWAGWVEEIKADEITGAFTKKPKKE